MNLMDRTCRKSSVQNHSKILVCFLRPTMSIHTGVRVFFGKNVSHLFVYVFVDLSINEHKNRNDRSRVSFAEITFIFTRKEYQTYVLFFSLSLFFFPFLRPVHVVL